MAKSAVQTAVTSAHRHLVTHPQSKIYYYRRTVPQDLLQHYQKREIKVSLKTSYREAALLLFGSVSQQVQMEFAMLRSGHHLHQLPSSQQTHQQTSHQGHLQSTLEHQQVHQPSMSLSALIALYLEEKSGGWTEKTCDEFKANFGLFERYFGKSKDVSQITRVDCIKLREKLLNGWGGKRKRSSRAPKTVNKLLTLLGAVFRYGIQSDHLVKNPCEGLNIKANKVASEERKPFNTKQLDTLFSTLPEGFEKVIPLVALYSGLRIEEVCQLRKKDIQVEDGVKFIDVQGSHLKTLSSKRRVPVHPHIESALQGILESLRGDDDYLFSGLVPDKYGCRSSEYSKWFGKFIRREARILDKAVTFHSLRHTFASNLKQAGVEHTVISELLGHSTKGTTARYAKGYSLKQLKEAVERLDVEV